MHEVDIQTAENDLLIVTIRGEITAAQVFGIAEMCNVKQSHRLELWDFTDARMAIMTDEALLAVQRFKAYDAKRTDGRTALVCPGEEAIWMGRTYAEIANLENATVTTAAFNSRAEAMTWLLAK